MHWRAPIQPARAKLAPAPANRTLIGRPRCSRSYRSGLSLLTLRLAIAIAPPTLHDARRAAPRSTAREEHLNISLAYGLVSEGLLAR